MEEISVKNLLNQIILEFQQIAEMPQKDKDILVQQKTTRVYYQNQNNIIHQIMLNHVQANNILVLAADHM